MAAAKDGRVRTEAGGPPFGNQCSSHSPCISSWFAFPRLLHGQASVCTLMDWPRKVAVSQSGTPSGRAAFPATLTAFVIDLEQLREGGDYFAS